MCSPDRCSPCFRSATTYSPKSCRSGRTFAGERQWSMPSWRRRHRRAGSSTWRPVPPGWPSSLPSGRRPGSLGSTSPSRCCAVAGSAWPGPGVRTGSHLLLGRAEQLPFPDASFDAVSFTYLLRYVADPAATLGELARVLRPGGDDGLVGVLRPVPADRPAGLERLRRSGATGGGVPDGRPRVALGRALPRTIHPGALPALSAGLDDGRVAGCGARTGERRDP